MSISFSNLRNQYRSFSLKWWETGLLITFFALFPLGQLEKIGLLSGGKIYVHDFVCAAWVGLHAVYFVTFFQNLKLSALWKAWKLEILLIGWIVVGIGVAFAHNLELIPLLYVTRIVIYALFAWSVGRIVSVWPYLLKIILLLVGSWYWWLAVLQYIFIPDARFFWLYGWDEHYYRMIGTLLDPGFTGILFVLSLCVVWSLKKLLSDWLFITANCALIAGIALTYSRASYLALAVSALLFFLIGEKRNESLKQRSIKILVVCMVFISAWVIAPKPGGDGVRLLRTTSIYARLNTMETAVTGLTTPDLIIGRGLFSLPAQYRTETELYQPSHATMPDNIFVTLLTQTGVVGLIGGSVVLGRILFKLWRKKPLFFIAFIAVIVHTQFNNTLLQPFIFLYLMLFLASESASKKITA